MEEEIKNTELENNIEPALNVEQTDPEQIETLEIQETIQEEKEQELGYEPVKTPEYQEENPKKGNIDLVTVSPVEFVSFEDNEEHLSDDPKANLDIMQDVKMHITVELGRARSSVKKILDLNKGSIVELNKVAGEQVELYANGRFIAYGEVIVIEDKFGLRVTNVSQQNLHNL